MFCFSFHFKLLEVYLVRKTEKFYHMTELEDLNKLIEIQESYVRYIRSMQVKYNSGGNEELAVFIQRQKVLSLNLIIDVESFKEING